MPRAREDHRQLLKYLRTGYPHGRAVYQPMQEQWYTATAVRKVLSVINQTEPWLFSILWYYYATSISRTNLALYKFIDSSTFKRKINVCLNKVSNLLMPFPYTGMPEHVWAYEDRVVQPEHKLLINYLRNDYSAGKDFFHPYRNETITAELVDKAMWELKQNQPEYHSLVLYYVKTQLNSSSIANARKHDYATLYRRLSRAVNMITLYCLEPELTPKGEYRVLLYPDSL